MRSVSQIYSEAVTIRNNYLQLTELNSGRSNSKLSILNALTYVVAVCIHTYETILDIFQVKIAEVLKGRINGTPDWYALIAKKFQYNSVTETGDELFFNENTLKIEYKKTDLSHRIIEKSAWQTNEDSNTLILKAVKANENSNEINSGIPYSCLTDQELTAFKTYIDQIKFVGAEIQCESVPGDIVTIIADKENPIFYNDRYVTAAQALTQIQEAFVNFANEFDFNSFLYYQTLLDVLRKCEHISDIGHSIKIYITSYNTEKKMYEEPVEMNGRIRLKSGFCRFLDSNGVSVLNSDNLTLIPESKMDSYYDTL